MRRLVNSLTAPADTSGTYLFAGSVTAETDGGSLGMVIRGENTLEVSTRPWVDRWLTIGRLPNRTPQISIRTEPGQVYWLEVSADLVEWVRLATLTPGESLCHFVDNDIAAARLWFYRINRP